MVRAEARGLTRRQTAGWPRARWGDHGQRSCAGRLHAGAKTCTEMRQPRTAERSSCRSIVLRHLANEAAPAEGVSYRTSIAWFASGTETSISSPSEDQRRTSASATQAPIPAIPAIQSCASDAEHGRAAVTSHDGLHALSAVAGSSVPAASRPPLGSRALTSGCVNGSASTISLGFPSTDASRCR